ncbi:MAG: hypothetical protein LAO06_09420 [Acidobacteriia bacterium]|nr:hypothetical protein [Terriglobia bacterium]
MNPLIIALTLLVTITAAVAIGVMLGYTAVALILHAMRRDSQPVPERTFTATEASSSG